MSRLRNREGTAWIIAIVAAACAILIVLLLIPAINQVIEHVHQGNDARDEQTAWDSALMQYVAGDKFIAIYDAVNKEFVTGTDAAHVEPYGRSKEHQGKVILVMTESFGEISIEWVEPMVIDENVLENIYVQ